MTATSSSSECSECCECRESCKTALQEQLQLGPYQLCETVVAEFHYSQTRRAVNVDNGQMVTIKVMNKDRVKKLDAWDMVSAEISILKQLDHPSIVKLLDVINTDDRIGLVMAYEPGVELFEHVLTNNYVKESKAKMLFAQLVRGVCYMHHNNVVHRDIKLENLFLVDEQHLIITDFGLATQCHGDVLSEPWGSPCYAAPEIVLGTTYAGPPVDIYSCGVVLYSMLCGHFPIDEENTSSTIEKMLHASSTFPYRISEDALDLIKCMLEPDPAFRYTIDQVIAHPWLEEHRAFLETSLPILDKKGAKTDMDDHATSTNSHHQEDDDVLGEGTRLLWDPNFLLLHVPDNGTKMHLVKPATDIYHQEHLLQGMSKDDKGRVLLPHYALSHLWRLSKTHRHLWHDIGDYVDDEEGKPAAAVPIRPEKRETLLKLLEAHPGSYWWIDVLCARTETPLGIMGDIYACCSQCVAMIDCSPDIIPSMHVALDRQQKCTEDDLDKFWKEVDTWDLFAQCDWWNRVWTWQEMVLPKTVVFIAETANQVSGCHVLDIKSLDLSFTLFERMSRRLQVDEEWKQKASYKWLTEIKISRRYNFICNDSDLPSTRYFKHFKLINIFANSPRQCMDPVDYVYGVLGVLGLNIPRKTDPKQVWQLFLSEMKVAANHSAYEFDLSTAQTMADVYQGLTYYRVLSIK